VIAAAMLAAAAPLACGAATRPGVAEQGADGVWRGRAVEVCRAVAERVAGAGAPIAFHAYDTPDQLRAAAADRIAFLTPDELAVSPLAAEMRAGPAVATGRQLLVVRAGSPLTRPDELAGRLVCFIIGTRAEAALGAWAARAGVPVERLAFQEPDEMADAFAVGKCAAAAVDAAEMPGDGARPLGQPLAATPLLVTTPARDGADWARLVASMAQRFGDRDPPEVQKSPPLGQ
jgi:general L-amino acid transport system substrate-binding protein